MKLLVIYPYIPWPLDRGTYQRTFHLLKSLSREHDIDFVALVSEDEAPDAREVFEEFCETVEFLPFTHPSWERLVPRRLLNPFPSNVAHWRSDTVASRVQEILKEGEHEAVHICDLVLAPYVLPWLEGRPLVVDRSRVDLQFQMMEHRTLDLPWKSKILRWESYAKLWCYEKQVARQAALEVVCGPDDEVFLRKRINKDMPVMVVPNGVDLDYFRRDAVEDQRSDLPTVLFCGAMDYSPNIDALRWFFGEIHEGLLARIPDLRVLVVGKNPTDEIQAWGALCGVTVTGGVPDVRPYYLKAWLQVVPLRIGGGTRLKIVESLAIGTAVVSTSIGAQGLGLEHNEEILLADETESFVDETARLLLDPKLRGRLEHAGVSRAQETFGWPSIGQQLSDRYHQLNNLKKI